MCYPHVLSYLGGLATCLMLFCTCLLAQTEAAFDPDKWRPCQARWERGEAAGIPYLILERGSLHLPSSGLTKGLLEFDFSLHGKTGFTLHFHQRHRIEHQALRLVQEGQQLTLSLEAFRLGRRQQLASHRLDTKLETDSWHHLRVALRDHLLVVYLNDLADPVWICGELQTGLTGTGLGLAVPATQEGWVGITHFRYAALDELYLFASD